MDPKIHFAKLQGRSPLQLWRTGRRPFGMDDIATCLDAHPLVKQIYTEAKLQTFLQKDISRSSQGDTFEAK